MSWSYVHRVFWCACLLWFEHPGGYASKQRFRILAKIWSPLGTFVTLTSTPATIDLKWNNSLSNAQKFRRRSRVFVCSSVNGRVFIPSFATGAFFFWAWNLSLPTGPQLTQLSSVRVATHLPAEWIGRKGLINGGQLLNRGTVALKIRVFNCFDGTTGRNYHERWKGLIDTLGLLGPYFLCWAAHPFLKLSRLRMLRPFWKSSIRSRKVFSKYKSTTLLKAAASRQPGIGTCWNFDEIPCRQAQRKETVFGNLK